jgi:hypothetical protein
VILAASTPPRPDDNESDPGMRGSGLGWDIIAGREGWLMISVDELETPALLVDVETLEHNLRGS